MGNIQIRLIQTDPVKLCFTVGKSVIQLETGIYGIKGKS
jgi:hypothetical protein